jgi:hypothetical protein
MAVAVSEPVAELIDNSNTATYSFGSFTPADSAILIALVFATGTVTNPAKITGGTLGPWNQLGRVTYNSTDSAYAFWVRTLKTNNVPSTFTFDCTGDNATGCIASMFSITGCNSDAINPIRQFKSSATTAANPTLTLDAACNTNNAIVAGFGMPRNPPTSTEPGSWTEISDVGNTLPTAGAAAAYRAGGETASVITFTSASAAYGMFAVEVWEATTGGEPFVDPIGATGFFGG